MPLLSGSTADAKTEQDNQKLFALYTAVNNLAYLASMSQRNGMTSGHMAGYNTRFQAGLQQVESFISTETFNNFTLAGGSAQLIGHRARRRCQPRSFGYTGGTIVSDANIADALPGVSASDSFTVSVTKGGTTTDVPIDLSQVQGTLTIDNIVNYVNQQLTAAGFSSRFKRVMTEGTINDPTNASYGIQIDASAGESVSLSSAAAAPGPLCCGTSGLTAATPTRAATIKAGWSSSRISTIRKACSARPSAPHRERPRRNRRSSMPTATSTCSATRPAISATSSTRLRRTSI